MSPTGMKKSPRSLQTEPWLGDCQAALPEGLSSGVAHTSGVVLS